MGNLVATDQFVAGGQDRASDDEVQQWVLKQLQTSHPETSRRDEASTPLYGLKLWALKGKTCIPPLMSERDVTRAVAPIEARVRTGFNEKSHPSD